MSSFLENDAEGNPEEFSKKLEFAAIGLGQQHE